MAPPLERRYFHHLGLVVDDVEKAAQHVEAVYGTPMRMYEPNTFRCRYLGTDIAPVTHMALSLDGPPHLELLQAIPETCWTPVAGVHHLAYTVEDLEAGVAALEGMGLPLEMGGIVDGRFPAGATYHRDPYGPLIELLSNTVARSMALRLTEPALAGPAQAVSGPGSSAS